MIDLSMREPDVETRPQAGIGLIEVVIAILILALISVALIPVLLTGIKQSASNAIAAAANQFASEQIELARAATTCSALATWSATATVTFTDARNVTLKATRTISGCSTSDSDTSTVAVDAYPGTTTATVTVIRTDTGATLSSATTLVYLKVYS